jgi:hypothetical protein
VFSVLFEIAKFFFGRGQGDQICRFFANKLGDFFTLGVFLLCTEVAQILALLFH